MYEKYDLDIKQSTYDWCVRAFSMLENSLGLNIKFHQEEGQVEAGQIFLFNHFARFETVIPPYLIHQDTGAYCRCVAAKGLFAGSEGVAQFLLGVGALPNDLPGLLPMLTAEILRGRKVIVFPEGGMVKDRRVIDEKGRYSIFSPTSDERRKHHQGAAVIALTLEVFKTRIRSLEEKGDQPRLERWAKTLELDGVEALLEAAHKPTLIIPANITFYPLRSTDNAVHKLAEVFGKGLSPRFIEELLIEGNILLKDTDMDVRFGDAIEPKKFSRWWERKVIDEVFLRIFSLDELFQLKTFSERWIENLVAVFLARETRRLRDTCMREMYSRVTVNLSHLTSQLILGYLDSGQPEVAPDLFNRALYLAIKNIQGEPSVHLHRILRNPEAYFGTLRGDPRNLDEFWAAAEDKGLVERKADRYRFLAKVREEHEFDEVRLNNPVQVYANEIAPVAGAQRAVEQAIEAAPETDDRALALLRFDDEVMAHDWCRETYSQPRHEKINQAETATESGAPYLLLPERPNGLGVVLVHGFLASPAELGEFGQKLEAAGYPVMGVRLAGHGTSPWDLRDRSWEDWLDSVRRGYRIMSAFVERICLVGFSTGGVLSLQLAAEQPEGLVGIAAISAPVKFRNRNLIFVPLMHGANKLVRWMSSLEGVMPFHPNKSEHTDINYRNIPVRGLYELSGMIDDLMQRLPDVNSPTLIVQGTEDRVVDPKSAEIIANELGSQSKTVHMVEAKRHGILNENTGDCQETVISFLESLPGEDRAGEPS